MIVNILFINFEIFIYEIAFLLINFMKGTISNLNQISVEDKHNLVNK